MAKGSIDTDGSSGQADPSITGVGGKQAGAALCVSYLGIGTGCAIGNGIAGNIAVDCGSGIFWLLAEAGLLRFGALLIGVLGSGWLYDEQSRCVADWAVAEWDCATTPEHIIGPWWANIGEGSTASSWWHGAYAGGPLCAAQV
eukprot:CAMPEP_0119310026 /NCGR_PEP_ID=MMETSP1333-20130426/17659_1 /TAXON_ID=418940 /ORGANISM="Scyphosphaera apsteinii, Strain RCC1455" /LENGTH=142 /DNA_ID=CAMNT_0007314141 /DNA_START=1082 /DNA_END=1510 /DNA_ORIENTATION=-